VCANATAVADTESSSTSSPWISPPVEQPTSWADGNRRASWASALPPPPAADQPAPCVQSYCAMRIACDTCAAEADAARVRARLKED
jgi:hypothetical protein